MCSSLSLVYFLLLLLNTLSATDCGYVDWSATVGSIFSVGEFILSENKCQSLSAELNVFGSIQKVDGAIKFQCDPQDNNRLIIAEYSDVLCTSESSPISSISAGEKIPLFNNNLYFTLNELVCSTTDCGIDITFSTDCGGANAKGFSHFSVPPDSCQTFGDDFSNALLRRVPYEIFPASAVDGLYSTALQFKCCAEDQSLLIYNYSDSNCLSTTSFNTLRLSNEYNGKCFALGNEQKPFDIRSDKAATEDVDHKQDVYALSYSWSCSEFVDCTGIQFMDEQQIPNLCPDHCLEPGYDAIEFTILPTTAPTASPTMHPVSEASEGASDVSGRNIHEEEGAIKGTTKYTMIGVLILLGVMCLFVIGYILYHRRKIKHVVEHTQQKQMEPNDSRYEPMIVSHADESNLIHVASVNDEGNARKEEAEGVEGEYVLPNTVTSGDTNDDASLLSQT